MARLDARNSWSGAQNRKIEDRVFRKSSMCSTSYPCENEILEFYQWQWHLIYIFQKLRSEKWKDIYIYDAIFFRGVRKYYVKLWNKKLIIERLYWLSYKIYFISIFMLLISIYISILREFSELHKYCHMMILYLRAFPHIDFHI